MIKKFTSQNGLRVIYEPMEHVKSVSIGIWVGTGSRHENEQERGLSHFIEHMLFKGTKTRSAKELAEAFDSVGGYVNAATAKDYTCYYTKVLNTQASFAIDVLADMFFNSVFDEEEIKREQGVVLEEISLYDDTPDDLVHELLNVASYKDHPLAYPILGEERLIKQFTRESILSFMNKHYVANNIVISICGNIGIDFIQYVEHTFSSLRKSGEKDNLVKPKFFDAHIIKKREVEQAHLCIGYESVSIHDPKIYSSLLVNNMLGGTMSSRLFQEIREKRGLAYSIYSFQSSYADSGAFGIYAGSAPEQMEEVFDTTMRLIKAIKIEGLSEREIHIGKEQLKGNLLLGLESTSSRMSHNGKNELFNEDHLTLDGMIEEINQISSTQVAEVIHTIFNEEDYFALSFISNDSDSPSFS